MPRFLFHFRNGHEFVEDELGYELVDQAAARAKAIACLRSILAEDVLGGRLSTHASIEVEDADKGVVMIVLFHEAVEIDEQAQPGLSRS